MTHDPIRHQLSDDDLPLDQVAAVLARIGVTVATVPDNERDRMLREAVARVLHDKELSARFVSELAMEAEPGASRKFDALEQLNLEGTPMPAGYTPDRTVDDLPTEQWIAEPVSGEPVTTAQEDWSALETVTAALQRGEHLLHVQLSDKYRRRLMEQLLPKRAPDPHWLFAEPDWGNVAEFLSQAERLLPHSRSTFLDRCLFVLHDKSLETVVWNRAENAGLVELSRGERQWSATYVVDKNLLVIQINDHKTAAALSLDSNWEEARLFSVRIAEAFDGYSEVARNLLKSLKQLLPGQRTVESTYRH
ncbi:hypothetical protein CF68_22560 [Cupriavidus sp. SK-4]|uniref:hypothetical protein n=1 Tax=Cupriavidus sp. SK-4 TaxID=574750 RepID=UPI00044B66E7|nr:hypothetical protein [Cupriavidus sp. SK-4]EYS96045.1 hypothetical protein CF68_22560 [Cupriavidus sp. SK-4]